MAIRIHKTRPPRHWRKALLVWAAAHALVGAAQAGGVYFQQVQLPNLPSAGAQQTIFVTALNNAGQVVGLARNQAQDSLHPFLYSGGQMVALGGALGAGYFWQPTALSDPTGPRGDVFVAGNIAAVQTGRPATQAFVQHVSSLMNQVSPAQTFFIPGTDYLDVVGINSSGLFAGTYGGAIGSRAFAGRTDGTLVTMDPPRAHPTSAYAINKLGQVIGSARPGAGNIPPYHAAIWDGSTGAYQDLGTLGGEESWAWGLNDEGTVVGKSNLAGDHYDHAFIYRNGVMTRIAAEAEYHGQSSALAINMKGQTLGVYANGVAGGNNAFLHTDAGGAVALVGVGYIPDGNYSSTSAAINDSGQILFRDKLYNPAGTLSWAKQAGGNAADPNNWDSGLGFAPNRFLDVVMGTSRSQTITVDSALTAKSLRVSGNLLGSATLQLVGGATVNALEGVTIEAYGRLKGAGRVLGPVVLNHGTVTALPGQLLTLDGGLDNHGLVTGNGRIEANLINRGGGATGVQVGAGQHLTLAGTVHTAADASRINIRDGGTLAFEGRFVNQGGAVLAIDRGTLQLGYGATRMDNGGQVLVGSGRAEILGDINNTPRGLVHAHDGADLTVWDTLRNDGEVRASSGSLIVYAGAVSGQGDFTGTDGMHRFQGGYGPGNSAAEVDIGNVQFASLVTMELGGLLAGSQHDRINFTGSARFEETSFLNITLINNFVPHAGDVFALFSYAQAPVGNFEDFYLPSLSAGLGWDVSRIHTTGVLAVTSVPEPSAAALWLAGLACMGAVARRRAARSQR